MKENAILAFFKYCLKRTASACWILFKLMIPVSIIIRLIQEFGLLPHISGVLEPVMGIVGLPAETAIVWLSAMVVNIYGGLLSMFSIYPSLSEPLTHSQLTILLTMILIAHTIPVEVGIAKKTGVKFWIMFLIRFLGAIALGAILNGIYTLTGTLQNPVEMPEFLVPGHLGWGDWALNELKNYGLIIAVIFTLVVLVRLLEIIGFMKFFNRLLLPLLGWLGISERMLPLTVIGMTMGLAYGGGLIVDEGRKEGTKPKDIFFSMTLMGLFHSIFEDTILIISAGGHWTGVILIRAIFAFLVTFIFVIATKRIDDEKFAKIFMTKAFRKKMNSEKTK
ncbi:MAG: hypothetical protein J5709_08850 [Bacteroidales bacterium]|nr:hypothetical protein [Bacteroidales bacterium]